MRKAMRDSISRYADARSKVIVRKAYRRVIDEASDAVIQQAESMMEKAKGQLEAEAAKEKDPSRKQKIKAAISMASTILALMNPLGLASVVTMGAGAVLTQLGKIGFNLTKMLPILMVLGPSAPTVILVKSVIGLVKKAVTLVKSRRSV